MKKTILIILASIFIANLSAIAQTTNVNFTYDNAGNRKTRVLTTITLYKSSSKSKDTANIVKLEEEFKFQSLADGNVKIYPNPIEGALKVRLEGFETIEGIVMQLYSTSGNLIEKKEVVSNFSEFNMSSHSSGIYILRLIRGNEKLEYKIIKR